jgi:hypothetical protein
MSTRTIMYIAPYKRTETLLYSCWLINRSMQVQWQRNLIHLRHDRHHAWNSLQLAVGNLSIPLDNADGVLKEGRRRVCEDGGQGPLDESVGANDSLAHAEEALSNLLIKDMVLVVDNDPTHPPAGDQVSLGEAATSQNRYCCCQRGDWNIGLKTTTNYCDC